MVCKIGFTNWNAKISVLRASMVFTYYIKLFPTGARQTQRYFNVSTLSSRRDNYMKLVHCEYAENLRCTCYEFLIS